VECLDIRFSCAEELASLIGLVLVYLVLVSLSLIDLALSDS